MEIKCIKNYEFPEEVIEFSEGNWYQISLNDCKTVGETTYFPIRNDDGDRTLFAKDCCFFDFNAIKM